MPARDAALREVVAEMQSHPDFMVKAYAKRLEALLAAPSEAGAHGWQQDRRGGQLDTPAVPEPGAVPKMPKAVLDAMSAYRDALADCAAEGHSWFASNAADDAHSAWWDATIAALAAAHAAGRREREGEIVALVDRLHAESRQQELSTQSDRLTSIMYGGRAGAFERLLDELLDDTLTPEPR